jgi:hypothetical protein
MVMKKNMVLTSTAATSKRSHFHVFGDEVGDHAKTAVPHEADQPDPGCADVEVEHALHVAHHFSVGANDNGEVGGGEEEEHRDEIKNF